MYTDVEMVAAACTPRIDKKDLQYAHKSDALKKYSRTTLNMRTQVEDAKTQFIGILASCSEVVSAQYDTASVTAFVSLDHTLPGGAIK